MADAEASLGITAAGEEFSRALSLSNYDTSKFTTYDLSLLATRLIGYDRCTQDQRIQIYSGWQQSWAIMNHIYGIAKRPPPSSI